MSEDVCRFCGYEGSDLKPIVVNETLRRFYDILPVDITRDNVHLPQSCCQLCSLKIIEILEFFDRIAEVDRSLRLNRDSSRKLSVELQSSNFNDANSKDHMFKEAVKRNISIKKITESKTKQAYPASVDPLDISYDALEFEPNNEEFMEAESAGSNEDYFDDEDTDPIYEPKLDLKKPNLIANKAKESSDSEIIVIDVSNSKYVCCRCRESFHTATLLKNHLYVASACHDADLTCKYCDKKFITRRKRVYHEKYHECKKPPVYHECTNCALKFVSRALFAIHRLKCTGTSIDDRFGTLFKCTECGEQLNSSAQLMKHTDNHAISKKIRKHLACEICGQTFDTKPLYHDHIRSHPEMAKFACNLCDKKYHTARLLHTHKYEHSGIKSNVCQECGKAFVKKSSLNNHRRREHTGETPYHCQICDMNFPTTDRLRIHQYKHIFKD